MPLQPLPPQLPEDLRPPLLRVDISYPDTDSAVVTPAGEADLSTVPRLRTALDEAVGVGHTQVIVDLDGLTFMDASTLRVLVEARQRLTAAGGNLLIRCSSPWSRRLLSLTGLDEVVDANA